MRLIICDTIDYVAEWSAKYVVKRINDFKPNENKYFVLGLPTGENVKLNSVFFMFSTSL